MTVTTTPGTTSLDERRAQGLQAWQRARDEESRVGRSGADSRETRMDLDRRREVLDREAEALRSHVPSTSTAPRLVLAHRQEWAGRRLADELTRRGYEVTACVGDGADAVGTCVAEQPDVLVLDDVLQRMPGTEVLAEVRAFSPGTRCVVQVGGSAMHGAFLDAGAAATLTRGATPAESADVVADVLAAAARETASA